MEMKFHLSDYDLTKLKCDLCHGYLSVPPVSSYRDKNACGRCNPEWERNVIYEQLAKHMEFPCIYCNMEFPWGMVQDHETKCKENIFLCPPEKINLYKISDVIRSQHGVFHKDCHNRIIRCPFEHCSTTLEIKNIIQHFNAFHREYVFNNSVEAKKILKPEKVWNFNSDTQVCLILFNNIPFLLFIHNDYECNETTGDILHYNYYFTIFTFCLSGCSMKYSVSLQSSVDDIVLCTRNKKNEDIEIFNYKYHCVNYLRGDLFKLNSFDFMTTKITKICRTDNLILKYHVKIVDDSSKINTENYNEPTFDLPGIERNFECPICKDYMSPPIYNCSTGHSICKNCRTKLTTCPYCQAILGYSRNFVLEDILETILLNCSNDFKGCLFKGKIQDIKLHQVMCLYN